MYDPRYIKEGHMVPIGDVLTERGVDLTRFAQGPLSNCTQDEQALLHRDVHRCARPHVQQGTSSTRRAVPYPSSTTPMTVDEYAALAKKLTVDERRPGQEGLGRRGRSDLLVDRSRQPDRPGRPDRGRRAGRRGDDPLLGGRLRHGPRRDRHHGRSGDVDGRVEPHGDRPAGDVVRGQLHDRRPARAGRGCRDRATPGRDGR